MKSRLLGGLAERRVKFMRLKEQDPGAARNAARGHVVGSAVMALFGGLINRLTGLFYLQYRPDSHYIFRKFPEYGKSFRFWTSGNMSQNGGDIARLYSLLLNAEDVLANTSKGDIAELGVFKGNSAGLFAMIAKKYKRKLFLFDTFAGFDHRDLTGADENNLSPFSNTELEKVRTFIDYDGAFFVKGRFPESLKDAPEMEEFAVVHIDCDLYAPAIAGIRYFFPRIVSGGMLILHDYGSGLWPGIRKAADEYFADRREVPVFIADKCGTVIFRKERAGE
jgi:hypothetical protein